MRFSTVIFLFGYLVLDSAFAEFAPMNFGSFPAFGQQFGQQKSKQTQFSGQTQGQGAAVGDGSADEGELSSAQNSNTNTTGEGTIQTGGSLGGCKGLNCKLSGASQVATQGQFQGQTSKTNSKLGASQGQGMFGGFPSIFTSGLGKNSMFQQQSQSQFGGGGAATGTGSVDQGQVTSAQDTKAIVNKDGSRVLSTNLGQGAGLNVGLSGAVQASGQGQTANQIMGKKSGSSKQGVQNEQGGALTQEQQDQEIAAQQQAQSQGDAAAAGQGSAVEGTAQNMQKADVITNAGGTLASSNSANTATGKGLKVGGAVSAKGGSQTQGASMINLSLLKSQMMQGAPRTGGY